jgi:tetratricopeptide (TPR) repeat protein
MLLLKFILGIFFLFLGWIYFFRPKFVADFNKFARETVFNDRRILLERKKLAIFFFLISFAFTYFAFSSLSEHIARYGEGNWKPQANKYLMYMAMKDYFAQRYDNAVEKYQRILEREPNNMEALARIAATYQAKGENTKATLIFNKIITINQVNKGLKKECK